jgi:acyl-coenzyme A synthetase/AMP-(fatty) acid ligase
LQNYLRQRRDVRDMSGDKIDKCSVAVHRPTVLELPITMLACARVGIIHWTRTPGIRRGISVPPGELGNIGG